MTTNTQLDTYVHNRLNLVIDATEINVINTQKRMLDQLGYDSYITFVNTSLDVDVRKK